MVEGPLAQVDPAEGLPDVIGRSGRGHRQVAAGDALAERHQVGADPAELGGEQRAGAPEADRHLVAHEQRTGLAAGICEGPELARIACLDADRPLHDRLDHHRREFACVLLHHRDGRVDRRGVAVAGGAQGGEGERVELVGAEAAVAHRHRTDRVAVVGAPERQVAGAVGDAEVLPVLEGDLDRLLHRHGAVRCEQQPRILHRQPGVQFLGELDHDPVAVAQHRGVGHPARLVGQRGVEFRYPVPERGHPQRGDGIQVLPAVDVGDVVPLGRLGDHRRVVLVRGHLGEAVPHGGDIALDPVCGHRPEATAFGVRRPNRLTSSPGATPGRLAPPSGVGPRSEQPGGRDRCRDGKAGEAGICPGRTAHPAEPSDPQRG